MKTLPAIQNLKPQRAVEPDSSWHFVGAQCDRADSLNHSRALLFHFPRAIQLPNELCNPQALQSVNTGNYCHPLFFSTRFEYAAILIDLVEDVIPFSEKLAVRRVRGGVFIENDPSRLPTSTFVVDLTGPHFDGDPSGVTTTFDVSLNGVKLDSPSPKPPIDAIFKIKLDMLRGLFDRNQIVVPPLVIHVMRSHPRLGGILGSSNEEITLPYKVSLLPEYAGTVTVTSQYPEYE